MNTEMQNKIVEYIDALSAKLGVAAGHLWGVLVKQQVISGMVYSVLLVSILLLAIGYTVFTYCCYRTEQKRIQSIKDAQPREITESELTKLRDTDFNLYMKLKFERVQGLVIEQNQWISPLITGFIVVAVSFILILMFLPDQALKIYNPEYYAIKEIINAVK